MDEKDKKIEELEQQIDDLLNDKYLDQKQKEYRDRIRTELEILVRSLYRDCGDFLSEESDQKESREVVQNLRKVIEQFSRDYNWPLY